jgi:hypothetical protein
MHIVVKMYVKHMLQKPLLWLYNMLCYEVEVQKKVGIVAFHIMAHSK